MKTRDKIECVCCKKKFEFETIKNYENEKILKAAKNGFNPFELYPEIYNIYIIKGFKKEDCLSAWVNELSLSYIPKAVCPVCEEKMTPFIEMKLKKRRIRKPVSSRMSEKTFVHKKTIFKTPSYSEPVNSNNIFYRICGLIIILLCGFFLYKNNFFIGTLKFENIVNTDWRITSKMISSIILFIIGLKLLFK